MSTKQDMLLLYSNLAAFIAIPIIWIVFAVIIGLSQNFTVWSDTESHGLAITVAIIVSFVTSQLVLLAFFYNRGAVIKKRWGTIDFGRIDLSKLYRKDDNCEHIINYYFLNPIKKEN